MACKYRVLPRVYDLGRLERYLSVLSKCSTPLLEIETRKLTSSFTQGTVDKETVQTIETWKRNHSLGGSDESEYRYLLRDLGLIVDRALDAETDLLLPLGGDGPIIRSFLTSESKARFFYLTEIGERLHGELATDRLLYENTLFWLILRNQRYLPLVQEVILNPKSYKEGDLKNLIKTHDSVSKQSALLWLQFFGIAVSLRGASIHSTFRPAGGFGLNTEMLARRLLAAAILEMNSSFKRYEAFYVKEIDRRLNETFSLSPSATDFVAALDAMFRHIGKSVIEGFKSSRGDISLPNHPNVSIVKIIGEIPLSISSVADVSEVRKITRYAREN